VLEVSFGYFIVPLLNILFGFLFLRERFSPWQWLAIGLAALALINLMRQAEQFPWLGLIIALTFAGYGLMRKVIEVQGMLGLWLEMVVLMPLSFIFLWYISQFEELSFGSTLGLSLLLTTTGIITSLPLLLFAVGARELPLATLGLLQFIAPTCFFILGIFVYEEPFSQVQSISFGLIWIAVVIYLSQIQRQAALQQKNKAQTVHSR
jgi:chloramphenicol-sensitive protein RarD